VKGFGFLGGNGIGFHEKTANQKQFFENLKFKVSG